MDLKKIPESQRGIGCVHTRVCTDRASRQASCGARKTARTPAGSFHLIASNLSETVYTSQAKQWIACTITSVPAWSGLCLIVQTLKGSHAIRIDQPRLTRLAETLLDLLRPAFTRDEFHTFSTRRTRNFGFKFCMCIDRSRYLAHQCHHFVAIGTP